MILPTDFVSQAKKLIDATNSPTEVDCRSAISRAYYYLFHESFEHLKLNHSNIMITAIEDHLIKYPSKANVDHIRLKKLEKEYLKEIGINLHGTIPNVLRRLRFKQYGRDFDDFRDDRNDADYELTKSFPLSDSTTKVSKIENLARSINFI